MTNQMTNRLQLYYLCFSQSHWLGMRNKLFNSGFEDEDELEVLPLVVLLILLSACSACQRSELLCASAITRCRSRFASASRPLACAASASPRWKRAPKADE